jgi:hypothetical protein
MNSADTATACRVDAQPRSCSNEVRNTKPPGPGAAAAADPGGAAQSAESRSTTPGPPTARTTPRADQAILPGRRRSTPPAVARGSSSAGGRPARTAGFPGRRFPSVQGGRDPSENIRLITQRSIGPNGRVCVCGNGDSDWRRRLLRTNTDRGASLQSFGNTKLCP